MTIFCQPEFDGTRVSCFAAEADGLPCDLYAPSKDALPEGMSLASDDLHLAGQHDDDAMVSYAAEIFFHAVIRPALMVIDLLPPVDFDELRATINTAHNGQGRQQLDAMIRLGRAMTVVVDESDEDDAEGGDS